MSALLPELLAAHRLARTPDLAAALQGCGLPTDGAPIIWGVEFVELDGQHYTPRAGGRPAIIIPVFEGSELVDLTATGLETRRTVTRLGIASMLGHDAIERAMIYSETLHLFHDPIDWLLNRCRGAVVLDWSVARFTLADLTAIACATDLLAKQVDKVLHKPLQVPHLYVREAGRAAA
jgi:hypothetical protein